jgi:excisionase family DNA binding protein
MTTGVEKHDRLHSVESAAEFLGGVSPYTIRAWLTEGRLTRIKVGRLTRVRESELLALIKPEPSKTLAPTIVA